MSRKPKKKDRITDEIESPRSEAEQDKEKKRGKKEQKWFFSQSRPYDWIPKSKR